jgi:hypothetical protein
MPTAHCKDRREHKPVCRGIVVDLTVMVTVLEKKIFFLLNFTRRTRICGLVVAPGYRSRGPGFDFRQYQIFSEVVCLELGPLSLTRLTERKLERKNSSSGLENRD